MTDNLPEAPQWIEDKIEFDPHRDVQDHHIVDFFQQSDRPYLSRKRVERELGLSDEGARKRLLALEELQVLDADTIAGGRIYWVHDDRSEWPIPPDVHIEPIEDSDEVTVSELRERKDVLYGGVAAVSAIIGSVAITGIVVAAALDLSPGNILSLSLALIGGLGAILAVGFGLLAVGIWVLHRRRTKSED